MTYSLARIESTPQTSGPTLGIFLVRIGPESDTRTTLSSIAPIPDADTLRCLFRSFDLLSASSFDLSPSPGSKLMLFVRRVTGLQIFSVTVSLVLFSRSSSVSPSSLELTGHCWESSEASTVSVGLFSHTRLDRTAASVSSSSVTFSGETKKDRLFLLGILDRLAWAFADGFWSWRNLERITVLSSLGWDESIEENLFSGGRVTLIISFVVQGSPSWMDESACIEEGLGMASLWVIEAHSTDSALWQIILCCSKFIWCGMTYAMPASHDFTGGFSVSRGGRFLFDNEDNIGIEWDECPIAPYSA